MAKHHDMDQIRDAIGEFARLGPLELSDSQQSCLSLYLLDFPRWNLRFHFSKYTSPADLINHLILPSLTLSVLLPESGSLIDLGSGPGIPGLILAIARPDLLMTCADSRTVSTEFIQATAAALKLANVRVVQGRAESLAHDANFRESFDIALARSFAPIPVVVEIATAFIRIGSLIIIPSSSTVSSRLADYAELQYIVGCAFEKIGAVSVPLPQIGETFFAAFRKLAPTLAPYPRTWKTMQRSPLWTS